MSKTREELITRALRKLGVEVWERAAVTNIEAEAVTVGAERLGAHTIIWSAGVAGSSLGKTLKVPVDRAGRVIVNEDLSVPDHPDIFVAGDLAGFTHQGGQQLPGVGVDAPLVERHPRRAGRDLGGTAAHEVDEVRWVLGHAATVGGGRPVTDLGGSGPFSERVG